MSAGAAGVVRLGVIVRPAGVHLRLYALMARGRMRWGPARRYRRWA